jgi:flagellar hook assembly protein FlgD
MSIVFPLAALTLLPMGTIVVTISFVSPSSTAFPLHLKIAPPTSKTLPLSSSVSVTVVVANKSKSLLPEGFSLSQNYPNPVNLETVIKYALPEDCHVELTIYNMLGQKVKTLVNQYQEAGNKIARWNGRDDKGYEIASGLYFYKIQTPKYSETKKMILLR